MKQSDQEIKINTRSNAPGWAENLGEELERNTAALKLVISDIILTKNDLKVLVRSLLINKTLTSITLSNNHMAENFANNLKELFKSTALISLTLSDNKLNNKDAKTFLKAVQYNTTLIHLDLSNNEITDNNIIAKINSCIFFNKSLKMVKMNDPQLTELTVDTLIEIPDKLNWAENLSKALLHNTMLTKLVISGPMNAKDLAILGNTILLPNNTHKLTHLGLRGILVDKEVQSNENCLKENFLNRFENNHTHTITTLDFSGNNISSGIAGYCLTHVKDLNTLIMNSCGGVRANRNSIEKDIAIPLQTHRTLIKLELSDNDLYNIEVISEALKQNTRLESLNLSNNGIVISKIVDLLKANNTLTTLDLTDNIMDENSMLIINMYLFFNKELRRVKMNDSQLTELTIDTVIEIPNKINWAESLSKALLHNTMLTKLVISGPMNAKDLVILGNTILSPNNTHKLAHVGLRGILVDKEVQSNENCLKENFLNRFENNHTHTITTLDFSGNNISSRIADYCLAHVKGLNTLIMNSCEAVGENEDSIEKDIAIPLQSHPTLINLELSHDNIDDVPASKLANTLSVNNTLITLNLSNNNIKDKVIIEKINNCLSFNENLSKIKENVPTLTEWDLSHKLADKPGGAKAIGEALKQNTTLESLNLSNNGIDDIAAQFLIDALTINNTLTTLKLSDNIMNNSLSAKIDSYTSFNKSLKRIKINDPQLTELTVDASIKSKLNWAESLSEALLHNTMLTRLVISGPMNAKDLAILGNTILSPNNNHKLAHLGLRGILVDKEVQSNENCLKENFLNRFENNHTHTITTLDFSGNNISSGIAGYCLANVSGLKTLIMNSCEGVRANRNSIEKDIAIPLQTHPTIINLELSNDDIDDTAVDPLVNAMKMNRPLTTLNLSKNIITQAGAKRMADAIKENNISLTLNLSGNMITEDDAKKLENAGTFKKDNSLFVFIFPSKIYQTYCRFININSNNTGMLSPDELSTSNKLRIMCDEKLDSAISIANSSEASFIKITTEGIKGTKIFDNIDEASIFYNSAKVQASKVSLFYIQNQQQYSPYLKNRAFNQGAGAYQELFGKLDYFHSDEDNSIYSPEAYFYDLMRIVSENLKCGDDIKSRRPDLFDVPLDGEHTRNLIPHLSIVNSVLAQKYIKCCAPRDKIIIIVVTDEASTNLSSGAKTRLKNLGCKKIEELNNRAPYACIINGNNVDEKIGIPEDREAKEAVLEVNGYKIQAQSAGIKALFGREKEEENKKSFVKVNGKEIFTGEFGEKDRGITIVILNARTLECISKEVFDTCGSPEASVKLVNYLAPNRIWSIKPSSFQEKHQQVEEVVFEDIAIGSTSNSEIFSSPFVLPLEEMKIYLNQLGTSLHEIYPLFKASPGSSLTLEINPQDFSDKEIACALAYLGITPAEAIWLNTKGEVIESPQDLKTFYSQTGLSPKELEDLIPYESDIVKENKVYFDGLYINQPEAYLGVINISLDIDTQSEKINNLTAKRLKRLAVFGFLAKKLDLKNSEVQSLIIALNVDNEITDTHFAMMAKVKWLQKMSNFSIDTICALFSRMPEVLFQKTYNQPELLKNKSRRINADFSSKGQSIIHQVKDIMVKSALESEDVKLINRLCAGIDITPMDLKYLLDV